MDPSDIDGEIDWYAVDAKGFVALMCSAGFGPVPKMVFEQWDSQRRIGEYLSVTSGACDTMDLIRLRRLLCEFGVYSYDWKHWEGPYGRIGSPVFPHLAAELGFSQELQNALIPMPLSFRTTEILRPELLLPCASIRRN